MQHQAHQRAATTPATAFRSPRHGRSPRRVRAAIAPAVPRTRRRASQPGRSVSTATPRPAEGSGPRARRTGFVPPSRGPGPRAQGRPANAARSMTRSGVTSRGCGAPRRRSESLNLTGGTAQKCRLIDHPVRMARSTHRFLHQSRRIMHGKPPHRRSEPRARHRGALLRSAVHARATRRDRCGLRAALPLALGSRPPRGRARARDGDGEEGEAVGEHQEAPGEEDLVHGGEMTALLACFRSATSRTTPGVRANDEPWTRA